MKFRLWWERTFHKPPEKQTRKQLIRSIMKYDKHFVLEDEHGEPYTIENLADKSIDELIEIKLQYLQALTEEVGE